MKTIFISFLSMLLFSVVCMGQGKSSKDKTKFGDIAPEDFDPSIHSLDSTADAVILYEKGHSHFRTNNDGWFTLIFEKHQRIKVLTKNGMDAANFTIQQYRDSKNEEKIEKLRAATFNLEEGKVIETKLNDKDIYKDKLDANYSLTKFGLPNVKEGSILDVTYTIASDFMFNLRAWSFQGKYPRVHSEYTARIPEFFAYVMLSQGYIPFKEKKVEKFPSRFMLLRPGAAGEPARRIEIPTVETETKWVMENVPSIKPEIFTTTIDNHIAKINFQLSEYRFPNQPVEPVMASWIKVADQLLKDEDFGAHLSKNNGWLSNDIKTITLGKESDYDKAKELYHYMRDKFTLVSGGGIYLSNNPKTLWKNMKGKSSDANLMLVTLMKGIGLNADPVLLGTREHGYMNEIYPIMNQYNHVICRVEIDGKSIFLDATEPMLGFGQLPLECYNGGARIIKAFPDLASLDPNALKEQKLTFINIFMNPEKPWEVSVKNTPGSYEAMDLRKTINEKGEAQLNQDIRNELPAEVALKELTIEHLHDYEDKLGIDYVVDAGEMADEDIIYINPLLGERQKKNPFPSANRLYPVEMPYTFKETIMVNLMIPEGYEADEIPKSTRVKLENDEGMFEYLIQRQGQIIQVRSVVDVKKAVFASEGYTPLRDFFSYIVKKQGEQIVLKKKT